MYSVVFVALLFGVLLAIEERRNKQRYEELNSKIRWLKDDIALAKPVVKSVGKANKKG